MTIPRKVVAVYERKKHPPAIDEHERFVWVKEQLKNLQKPGELTQGPPKGIDPLLIVNDCIRASKKGVNFMNAIPSHYDDISKDDVIACIRWASHLIEPATDE